jgi:hypothetical protein
MCRALAQEKQERRLCEALDAREDAPTAVVMPARAWAASSQPTS